VLANTDHPSRELMWGAPGTMLAAQVMLERTGDAHWLDAWRRSADRLWDSWREDVWVQDLGGKPTRMLGAVHGFAGNAFALARGGLDPVRRAELERRALAVLARHAERADGLAQWPASLEPGAEKRLTQICHGAPGIIACLANLAPGDESFGELLRAGGELTWRAGPLRKGAGLCHGTAGNGYALLALFARTGDSLWLDRARRFAMHAIAQVERATAQHGCDRYTLWTGDIGTALYLHACMSGTSAFPIA
jgi:hypothetical protein